MPTSESTGGDPLSVLQAQNREILEKLQRQESEIRRLAKRKRENTPEPRKPEGDDSTGSHTNPTTGRTQLVLGPADFEEDPTDLESSEHEPEDLSEFLAGLYAEKTDPKSAPDIHEPVAACIADYLRKKPDIKEFKQDLEKCLAPKNFKAASDPIINMELFLNLNGKGRDIDRRNRFYTSSILKGILPLTSTLSNLISLEAIIPEDEDTKDRVFRTANFVSNISEMRKNIELGIKVLSNVYCFLQHRRRAALKPFLSKGYYSLCASNVPITDNLFGENITETCKNLAAVNRAKKQTGVFNMTQNFKRNTTPKNFQRRGTYFPTRRPQNQYRRGQPQRRQFFRAKNGHFHRQGQFRGNNRA